MKPISTLSDDEFAHLAQRAARLPDAPAALVQAALALWPAALPAHRPLAISDLAASALRLIQAGLRLDSWALPAVALGVRDAGCDARHLLFSAAGRDIDLRVMPTGDRFALSGQVLGPDVEGEVELSPLPEATVPDAAATRATLDGCSEFHFDGVSAGRYRLSLRVGTERIQLPPVDVCAHRA